MNFLLIVIDSLRADHLGCYGYGRATSPKIDRLADRAVVFENLFAAAVPTQPSFTSLFSGQFSTTHGIVAHRGHWTLDDGAPFLPELLKAAGYETVAVDNLADQHQPWFFRGFEHYINPRVPGTFPDCTEYNRCAIEWLARSRREPFFLFVHYWDPHTPYMPPAQYRGLFYEGDPTTADGGTLKDFYRQPLMDWWVPDWLDRMAREWPGAEGDRITDIEFVRSQYDSEIRCSDDGVQELTGELERLGLLDDTMVILLGDHGEELGEHGIYFDHHGLYESNIHVPLIIRPPGGVEGGLRIPVLVQHHDIAPTVLEASGLPRLPSMDGRSLMPWIRGGGDTGGERALLTEECTWMAKRALREEGRKLIVSREPDFYGKPERELYDLVEDPGEQHNLADMDSDLARDMEARLESELGDRLRRAGRREDPVLAHGITLGKKMFA